MDCITNELRMQAEKSKISWHDQINVEEMEFQTTGHILPTDDCLILILSARHVCDAINTPNGRHCNYSINSSGSADIEEKIGAICFLRSHSARGVDSNLLYRSLSLRILYEIVFGQFYRIALALHCLTMVSPISS